MILPTAYLPSIGYVVQLMEAGGAEIEVWESYPKQTFRNRCEIVSPNGRLTLTVPVLRSASKQFTKDVEISYATPWQRQHWQALISSYKHTPYFDYYAEFVQPCYAKRYKYLIDLNLELLDVCLRLMRKDPYHIPKEVITFTQEWHGRKFVGIQNEAYMRLAKPWVGYHQIFADRCGFQENVSVIDYLFNEGGL